MQSLISDLMVLKRAFSLATDRKFGIYIDSRSVFGEVHYLGILWKIRGFKSTAALMGNKTAKAKGNSLIDILNCHKAITLPLQSDKIIYLL